MHHLSVAARVIFFTTVILLRNSLCRGSKGRCSDECCNNYKQSSNGTCEECPPGTFGYQCTEECPKNYYGHFCRSMCSCHPGQRCHRETGCINDVGNGCPPGTFGYQCTEECPKNYNGPFCNNKCFCLPGQRCHRENGCINDEENGSITNDNSFLVAVLVGVVVFTVGLVICIIFFKGRSRFKGCFSKFRNANQVVIYRSANVEDNTDNSVNSRYLNLDCLNEVRHDSLPVPDVVPSPLPMQDGSIIRHVQFTNPGPDSYCIESKRLSTDSGEFVSMRSGHAGQNTSNHISQSSKNERSVYEEMSLIRSCREKLSSFFRRRQKQRSENSPKRTTTRFSAEMLEARNTFYPRYESELPTTYENPEINICSSSRDSVGNTVTGRKYSSRESQALSYYSMNAAYESCFLCVPDANRTNDESHSTTTRLHRESPGHSNRSSYMENGKVDEASYHKPWENTLPVHVQEYKEVAEELQRTNLTD